MSGHHRRGSDPESSDLSSPRKRRPSFQRHWSIPDLSPRGAAATAGSVAQHNTNVEAIQAIWSSGENFLGGDAVAAPITSPSRRVISNSKRISSVASAATSTTSEASYPPPLPTNNHSTTTATQSTAVEVPSSSQVLPHTGGASAAPPAPPEPSTTGTTTVPPPTTTTTPSSIIHDAARITDWDQVLDLCHTHPAAAAYAGPDGWTALHHACNRRCPRVDVVQALIAAYPAALLQQEQGKAWLPLHFACRFKAPPEVVALLLHMVPESGKTAVRSRDSDKGRRPLYYAIRYDAPPGVAELLIKVDPSAILDDDHEQSSPLALVWDAWAEKLEGKRIVHSFLPGGFPEPEDTTPEQRAVLLQSLLQKEPKLKKRWNQVNVLLQAAFGFPIREAGEEEDTEDGATTSGKEGSSSSLTAPTNSTADADTTTRKWRIVHATAAVKCHISLFLLACALHPEQARELDEYDLRAPNQPIGPTHQTALHLAASSKASGEPGKTVIYTLLSYYREAAEMPDAIDGSLPLHRMVENPRKQDWVNHSAVLYHFYQRAVQIPDRHGKLPLHRATASITHETFADGENHEDHSVIIQLVRAYPQAASAVDHDRCMPLHYLAQHAQVWDDDVASVHNAHRLAVQARAGTNQALPLHMAAANPHAEASLIQQLVDLHPRGASMATRDGKLPFHYACEMGKAWEEAEILCEAFPRAAGAPEQNDRGWYPLHMASAAAHNKEDAAASSMLLSQLITLHPQSAHVADTRNGRYPLHLACEQGKSWRGGLQALFDANPAALLARDRNGCLPLHICALAYCRKDEDDNEEWQTKAAPKAEAEKELTETTAEAAQLDILFHLLRADPTTLTG